MHTLDMQRSAIRTGAAVFVSILCLTTTSTAQRAPELWWPFICQFEKGPGSVFVDLALKKRAPVEGFRSVVITGVYYRATNRTGLPDGSELDTLNALSGRRQKVIDGLTHTIRAGTFTYDSQRLDYVYVADTTGIRAALEKFYTEDCPGRRNYINIRYDPTWQGYLGFLFPNQQTIEFYRNDLTRIGFFELMKQ